MKKVSFRVRNFDKDKFLTFNIDNEANLDEEVLDFLDQEEPNGIVSVIFEEGEEFDTFSYDITNKIHLSELSNQEINAEMVLSVFRGIILALVDMREYRIPLSYLVLNRDYIYIDSDYKVEFVCIPLEEMNDEVDVTSFLRNFLANLRFDSMENGDYVAKLFTYINNTSAFKLDNMLALIEELMVKRGMDVPDDNSANIYADYQEISDDIMETADYEADFGDAEKEDIIEEVEEAVQQEEFIEEVEEAVQQEEFIEKAEEPEQEIQIFEEIENSKKQEEVEYTDETEQQVSDKDKPYTKKLKIKKDEMPSSGIVLKDDLDEFLAENTTQNNEETIGTELKINKNIKVSRASIVNIQEELKAAEELEQEKKEQERKEQEKKEQERKEQEKKEQEKKEKERREQEQKEKEIKEKELKEAEDEDKELSNSIFSKAIGITSILGSGNALKVNPYLVRVNTEEKIIINKQNFRIGKANMGVDYTVKGNGAVSRFHATIINKDDVYYIKDNKSTNHTYVNDKRVADGENELLTHDCKIVLGDEEFVFKLR